MSTAHPVIDPDRDVLWTVNTFWGQLHVVRWDGEGPVQMWPIAGALIPQSVHTITQTRDWLIVGDCAFKVEPQVLAGGDRTEPANHSGPVFVIRKDALEAVAPGTEVEAKVFEIAPEINHYYATYDDGDGIGILFEHTESADIAMTQGEGDLDALGRPCDPALRGLYGFPMSPDRTTFLVFDPESGEVVHRTEQRQPDLLWTRQLNAMDWSTEGRIEPERAPHRPPGLATRGRHPEDARPLRRSGRPHAAAERGDGPAGGHVLDARPRHRRRCTSWPWTTSRPRRSSCHATRAPIRRRAATPGPIRAATTATWSCR